MQLVHKDASFFSFFFLKKILRFLVVFEVQITSRIRRISFVVVVVFSFFLQGGLIGFFFFWFINRVCKAIQVPKDMGIYFFLGLIYPTWPK